MISSSLCVSLSFCLLSLSLSPPLPLSLSCTHVHTHTFCMHQELGFAPPCDPRVSHVSLMACWTQYLAFLSLDLMHTSATATLPMPRWFSSHLSSTQTPDMFCGKVIISSVKIKRLKFQAKCVRSIWDITYFKLCTSIQILAWVKEDAWACSLSYLHQLASSHRHDKRYTFPVYRFNMMPTTTPMFQRWMMTILFFAAMLMIPGQFLSPLLSHSPS